MENIKTTFHPFRFNLDNPEEKQQWKALQKQMKAESVKLFDVIDTPSFGRKVYPEVSTEIELETAHLFNNQWNTAPVKGVSEQGLRVFDFYRSIVPNRKIIIGHYLEQTDAMREVRRNTLKCGYCGRQEPAAKGYVFCPHCIDSEYLTEDRLHLTRLAPIYRDNKPRAELTDAERANLLPQFIDAQIHGKTERGKARLAKQRQDIISKCDKETRNAIAERDGLLWLLDHGISIDNVIYYDHKEMFSFGWRQPVSDAVASRLLDIASEFPFEYEIKSESKVYSAREAA